MKERSAAFTTQPKVVLFDALGTLLELKAPGPRLRALLEARCGQAITEAEATAAIGAEIAFYRQHLQVGRDEQSLALLRRRCALELRHALPAHVGGIDIDLLTEILLAALEFEVYPDVEPTLTLLDQKGVRVGVVSNWDCSLPVVLGKVGIAGWFEQIVSSAAVGVLKPDRRIFLYAAAQFGFPPEAVWFVGDSFEVDVRGSQAAGMTSFLLLRTGERSKAADVSTLTSLCDLPWLSE